MDALLQAAARALARGRPVDALGLVALREDAPSLALRATAMAQLGELSRAKSLMKRAERGFDPTERVARARCAVASAEIRLALRELAPVRGLRDARATLSASGDRRNALHAALVEVRRSLLLGQLGHAQQALGEIDLSDAPPALVAIGELCRATIAQRSLATRDARASLHRALRAARLADVPPLIAEVEEALGRLDDPAARLISEGEERLLSLDEVEQVLASSDLVVDACRRRACQGPWEASFARRPVLFALLRVLAEAWPRDVPRETLIVRVFGARRTNESHRARLRVELGRLRRCLHGTSDISATPGGFLLAPKHAGRVVVLIPPIDGDDAALLALLADGEAWSTSALSLAVGASQRTVQRALTELESAGRVRSSGRARAQRWLACPTAQFTTTLLLPTLVGRGHEFQQGERHHESSQSR